MIFVIFAVLAVGLLALLAWRRADHRAEQNAWRQLVSHQPAAPARFDPAMVAALPDPARRFFRFAIAPGTPLHTVAEIAMTGEFSLGSKDKPGYMPMRAEQVLAAPHGFIWKARAGDRIWFSGSDGAAQGRTWSRFWLLGIVPVARAGNNADHFRAAFGRYVAEAVFWTPAALLPSEHVRWEAIDDSSARVDPDSQQTGAGRPTSRSMPRVGRSRSSSNAGRMPTRRRPSRPSPSAATCRTTGHSMAFASRHASRRAITSRRTITSPSSRQR